MGSRRWRQYTRMAASSPTRFFTSSGSRDDGSMRADTQRRGSALLDVVIALVVLGLSGTAFIALLGQTAHSVRKVRNTERLTRLASDELGRFVLYDRARVSGMLGQSFARGWSIRVEQSAPGL